jgi:hypothetical protein
VEKLFLSNSKPQLSRESNKHLSIIKFDHLTNITLYGVHDDYIELFLDHTKTFLSNNVHPNVEFEPLKRVTFR